MATLLDWRVLSPFGVSVDLDLSLETSGDAVELLRRLYDAHHLLVFSSQKLSHEDQTRVAAWFGPVLSEDTAAYVSTDPGVGGLGSDELPFHSDLSCSPHPLLGLSLHAVEVEDGSTSTIFVDAMRAAAALPDELRDRLGALHSLNLWPRSLSARQRAADAPEGWPGTAHPLLMPHPRTGDAILYLNASHTDRIVELEPEQSEDLIQDLFTRLYAAENRYEHRWRSGDLVVWDNLALQHARPPIAPGATRTLQRVAMGTHSQIELMPDELWAAYRSDGASA